MIGYVMLGTSDLARAEEFFDRLLGELGTSRAMDNEGFIAWATAAGGPMVSVTRPFDGNSDTDAATLHGDLTSVTEPSGASWSSG